MKLGTAFFLIVILLVGFGYLFRTSIDQSAEIRELSETNVQLRLQLDEADAQIANQDKTIESLESRLVEKDAEVSKLMAGLVELNTRYQIEVENREQLAGDLLQCQGMIAETPALIPPTGGGRSAVAPSGGLWLASFKQQLWALVDDSPLMPWLALLFLAETGAAAFAYRRHQEKGGFR